MERPLNTSAWSGILSAVISVVSYLLILSISDLKVRSTLSILFSILAVVFGVMFLYGFVFLGKKFNNKLLVVMAWIGISFAALMFVSGVGINLIGLASAQVDSSFNSGSPEMAFLLAFLFMWIISSLIFGAYSILMGIGIMKLQDKVPLAKATGILNIVAGATYIILIGIVVAFVAYIMQIILMFKASEKFEKR